MPRGEKPLSNGLRQNLGTNFLTPLSLVWSETSDTNYMAFSNPVAVWVKQMKFQLQSVLEPDFRPSWLRILIFKSHQV
jgi:hypothetical protein